MISLNALFTASYANLRKNNIVVTDKIKYQIIILFCDDIWSH
jgi:hypothetical protein